MKRILSLLTAAVLLAGTTACRSEVNMSAPTSEPQGATFEVQLSSSCKSAPLFENERWECYQQYLCGEYILLYGYDLGIALIDPETGAFKETTETGLDGIPFATTETGSLRCAGTARTEDGIHVFATYYSIEDKTYSYYLLSYDTDLQLLSAEDVTADWDGVNGMLSWLTDSNGIQYVSNNDGMFVKMPGEPYVCVKSSAMCPHLFMGRNDYVLYADSGEQAKHLNMETLSLEPLSMDNMPKHSYNNCDYFGGSEEYDFTYSDGKSLYGVKAAENIREELICWEDSDVSYASGCILLPDHRIVAAADDTTPIDRKTLVFTPRTQEEAEQITLISFASGYGVSDDFRTLVHRFNRQSDGYRIVIRVYDDEDHDKGRQALTDDLLSGTIPDIIDIRTVDYLPLSNKGLFEDLAPYMDSDPDFHKEDYMMNFLEALRFRGRQEKVAFNFITITNAVKTKYLNGKNHLTAAELLAMQDTLPEEMALFHAPSGRTEFMYGLTSDGLNSFVDYENGTCSFDSEEFIALLKIIGTVSRSRTTEDSDAWSEDRALVYRMNYARNLSYALKLPELIFGGEDYTFVGIPSVSEGNGSVLYACDSIAVSSASLYKQQIWEFIKFCMQEENYPVGDFVRGYPVNREAMQKQFAYEMESEDYQAYYQNSEGENIALPHPTQEDAETLTDFLEGITVCQLDDSKIEMIVREEAGKYCFEDCTAEEAAQAIQSRVSLYLAEQY